MFNRHFSFILLYSIIAFIIIAALFAFFFNLQPVADQPQDSQKIIIRKGEGLREISAALKAKGLIRSRSAFEIYSLLSGNAFKLKPGHYQISPNWSAVHISNLLKNGIKNITVVIFPGETVKDIDKKLAEAGVIEEGELINFQNSGKSLEGYLFPDTYKFSPYTPIDKIVKEFFNNFEKKVQPILAKSNENPYNALIVASLLEKETPFSRDRRIIAGIINNRLRLNMPLQVDATVVYAKCNGRFTTCPTASRQLSKKDLNIGSPYNTYRYRGLPPTPIANPGLDAVKAAVNPVATDYLFYISHPRTQRTIFSRTLDEHNRNRIKYLIP